LNASSFQKRGRTRPRGSEALGDAGGLFSSVLDGSSDHGRDGQLISRWVGPVRPCCADRQEYLKETDAQVVEDPYDPFGAQATGAYVAETAAGSKGPSERRSISGEGRQRLPYVLTMLTVLTQTA
jgi:hypothetical protein